MVQREPSGLSSPLSLIKQIHSCYCSNTWGLAFCFKIQTPKEEGAWGKIKIEKQMTPRSPPNRCWMYTGKGEVIQTGKHKTRIRTCWAGTETSLRCPPQGRVLPCLRQRDSGIQDCSPVRNSLTTQAQAESWWFSDHLPFQDLGWRAEWSWLVFSFISSEMSSL